MKVETGKQTTYRLSPLRLWLVPALSVGFGVMLLWLGLDASAPPNTRNLGLGMGVVAFGFAAVMYLILRRTRLVLSDEAVQLYQAGYKLETAWDNVAGLDHERGFEGLILHRPMECPGARTLSDHRHTTVGGTSAFSPEQIQLIAQHRFIPLAAFAYSLRKGQLHDDLTRRAGTRLT